MSLPDGPAAKVVSTFFEYGKLGLLVEDAPDAELRTARELYAADGLPDWWIQIDNLMQAEAAIREALAAVGPDGPAWAQRLPLLVILDRYLKVGGEEGDATQVVSWDPIERGAGPAALAASAMRQVVKELEDECGRLGSCVVEKITSYPGDPAVSTGIPWKSRHHEPLFHLRRTLESSAPELLLYGPAPEAPAREPAAGLRRISRDQRRHAACRVRLWHPSITELAAALCQEKPPRSACVLFTGAGASLANHRLAPGIPPTWFLLEWACWSVCIKQKRRGALDRPEPTWPPAGEARRKSPARKIPVNSLEHLIELYHPRKGKGKSVAELDWEPLENLFKPRPREKELLNDFGRAFRHILQRYDHGFPYHSWLLARLPWTLVVSTNFDGFHERAASAAVSAIARGDAAFVNESFRRLGFLLPEVQKSKETEELVWDGPRTFDEICDGPGLFKPYGSLTTMGPLALARDEFWQRVEPIGHCFNLIRQACDECWLVVVGHGMASTALDGTLVKLVEGAGARKGFSVRALWVDPQSCRLATERRAYLDFRGRFENGIDGTVAPGRHHYDPIPARALDFAYDLWQEYLRLRRQAASKTGTG